MGTRLGIVTGRATAQNRNTGPLVRLLQVQLTDLTDVQTVQLVAQAGEESSPPNGSLVAVMSGGGPLKMAVGTDDGIEPIMDPGGKRVYSTGPDAEVIADIQFKPDGRITLTNPKASVDIAPDGTFVITNPGATITVSPAGLVTIDAATIHLTGDLDVDGTITAPNVVGTTDVVFAGKSASAHIHSGVQTGTGNTGAPV